MNQEQRQEQGQKSGFGHHMKEAELVIDRKQIYEQKILTSDLNLFSARDELISLSKIQASEIRSLASDQEKQRMSQIIALMETCSSNIQSNQYVAERATISDSDVALMMSSSISAFKKRCHEFLDIFIQVQDRANLQFNKLKELGEIQRYLDFNEVDIRFPNNSPEQFLISPQMELFSRGLDLRSRRGQNNIIIVSAKMGKGKSTFTIAGASTLSSMRNVPFHVNPNIVLSEDRAYCEKLLTDGRLPNGSSVIFDQAGNQMSSASRWEDDQVNLLNKIDLNRFSGMTLWINWHAAKALDKDIRERVATHEVSIDKIGGPAVIKGFNLNPHSNGPVVDQKTKNRIAITPHQAQEITEKDALKLLEVPFYEIGTQTSTPAAVAFWNSYFDKKTRAKRYASRIVGKSVGVDLFYNDFLATLDPNVVRISSEALKAYGESKATYLSMKELGKRISSKTHQKLDSVFKNTNLLDANEGYIEIDGYARTYIQMLHAEKQGAVQFAKEQQKQAGE